MTTQLSFDLPVRFAYGRDSFFISIANELAVKTLDHWQDWPAGKLILYGAKGSGKTHLSDIWQSEQNAQKLVYGEVMPLAGAHCVVEDIAQYALDTEAQNWLFHLHNYLQNTGGVLLMTAAQAPPQIPFSLPDLRSRIAATSSVRINLPDDALLNAILLKHFSDRQLRPSPNVLPFLVSRMPRSFEGAEQIVKRLDQIALEQRKPIVRAMAAQVLAEMNGASSQTP